MRQLLARLLGKLADFFKPSAGRHQYFDERLASEQWDLLEAAALLQITEFRIFELAYKEWFGHRPRPYIIERYFKDYMFNRAIPAWVTHFCRRVVALGHAGELDPRDFGIYYRLPSRRMTRIGQLYIAFLLAAFLGLVWFTYGERVLGGSTSSLFGRGDEPSVQDRPHQAVEEQPL